MNMMTKFSTNLVVFKGFQVGNGLDYQITQLLFVDDTLILAEKIIVEYLFYNG
jgi:hypothetical protein